MRYVFFFVALLSAFFSYAAYDPELGYDPDDLKMPDDETKHYGKCMDDDFNVLFTDEVSNQATAPDEMAPACTDALRAKALPASGQCPPGDPTIKRESTYKITLRQSIYEPYDLPDGGTGCRQTGNFSLLHRVAYSHTSEGETCPPEMFPDYEIPVQVEHGNGDTQLMCAKPLSNPDSCPALADDSLSTINFTSPDVNSVCFDNPNGEGECAYEVTNGMYNLPPELSTAEPVQCGSNEPVTDDTPPLDPEENCYETTNGAYCNEDPDEKCSVVTDPLTGDSYTQCEENCGYINGDFFCLDDGTDTPDEPPVPSECQDPAYRAANPNKCKSNQDTDKDGDGQVDNTDIVEAINQLSSQGDDRANTLNKLLGETIEGNSLSKEGNKLLKKISDKLDKEDQNEQPFTATAERKGQGPLDSLFNDAWTAETEASIESLKSDIGNFRQQIQSDMDGIFSLSSFSGSYSQIKHQIFGVDTDFSMSRFQELFQALAAAFMFVAVIYAVYILLS